MCAIHITKVILKIHVYMYSSLKKQRIPDIIVYVIIYEEINI